MEFKIEKKVPLPKRQGSTGFMDALRMLKPGDSFELPAELSLASCRTVSGSRFPAGTFSWRKRRVWRLK